MRKERNFPFVDQKVKVRGEIPVDDDGMLLLPPILWEKVLIEVRKREEQKIWPSFKKLFKRNPKNKPMAFYVRGVK